jgi:hypothetical protein
MSVLSLLRDTKSIGELSEMIVMGALASAGYRVAIPLGENHRHDLIIEKGGSLSRVQAKTGRVRKAPSFSTATARMRIAKALPRERTPVR